MTRFKLIGAIILNLVAFPGAGQLYLKRKVRGVVYAAVALVIVLVLTANIISLVNKNIPPVDPNNKDIMVLYQSATALSTDIFSQHDTLFKIYFFLLGTSYIVSIADLFWIRESLKNE